MGRQHPIVGVAIALPSNAFSRVTIAKRVCCDVASFAVYSTVLIYGDY